jgi:hypothetical protein
VSKSGTYPSANWQSNFVIISDPQSTTSLLLSVNDAQQQVKSFISQDVEPDGLNGSSNPLGGISSFNFYSLNNNRALINSTGTVTLSPVKGNWLVAANKYGNWMNKQLWGSNNTALVKCG